MAIFAKLRIYPNGTFLAGYCVETSKSLTEMEGVF